MTDIGKVRIVYARSAMQVERIIQTKNVTDDNCNLVITDVTSINRFFKKKKQKNIKQNKLPFVMR